MTNTKTNNTAVNTNKNANRGVKLETMVLATLGYTQATNYKSHADGYTPNGQTVQVKCFIGRNKCSISTKYFKQIGYNKTAEEMTVQDMFNVIEQYFNGIDKLILVYSEDGNAIDNIVELEHNNAIEWVKQHAKRSYIKYAGGGKYPQIKIGKTIPKEQ
nr:MAG TPA: hypothetical protein [Caudoviricetes sp.]